MTLAIVLFCVGGASIITSIAYLLSADDGAGSFFMIAIGFGIGGVVALSNAQENDVPNLTAQQACVESSARPMPTSATLNTVTDDRLGPIYPCYFLLDEGFVPGRSTPLMGNIREAVFDEQHFKASSDWGGFLLFGGGFGGGAASGSSSAQGDTVRKDEYAFMAETTDGSYVKIVINAEAVQLATCVDCKPSVKITVGNDSMFTKLKDGKEDRSIWSRFPGGLQPPGAVLQALGHVVVTLPQSLTPTPVG